MTENIVSNGVAYSSDSAFTKRKPKSKNNRLNHKQSFDLTKWVLEQLPKTFKNLTDMTEKGSKALGFSISTSSLTYMASQHEIDLKVYLKEQRTIMSPSKKIEKLASMMNEQYIQIQQLTERISKIETILK